VIYYTGDHFALNPVRSSLLPPTPERKAAESNVSEASRCHV